MDNECEEAGYQQDQQHATIQYNANMLCTDINSASHQSEPDQIFGIIFKPCVCLTYINNNNNNIDGASSHMKVFLESLVNILGRIRGLSCVDHVT